MFKVKETLLSRCPDLANDFDVSKNVGCSPDTLGYSSRRHVWWKCHVCGHEWETTVKHRSRGRGCPCCSGFILSDKNRFSLRFPEVAKDFLPYLNGGISPDNLAYSSNVRLTWLCHKCGFVWTAFLSNRTHKSNPTGCPRCSGRTLTDTNSLLSVAPLLREEWDYDKNEGVLPESVFYGSNKKVWWRCSVCGYSWKAIIASRAKKKGCGSGCPKCAGNVLSEKNSLQKKYPEISAEWDVVKNNGVLPTEVSYGSDKKYWWECKKGHSWKASINSRTNASLMSGCPQCGINNISVASQKWLDTFSILFENREKKISLNRRYVIVDGFDPTTNTVYEFLGDYWHGNPNIFSSTDINKTSKQTFGFLYQKTMSRIEDLNNNGYNVLYVWEDDFYNGKKQSCFLGAKE